METEKIEITLNYANNSDVDLENMSIEVLESFLSVTNSLKNIAQSISPDVSFTIKKGSAYTAVNGTYSDISNIYQKMEDAINGDSDDEIITSNLRKIQKEIQNEVFAYQFKYSNVNLDDKIREAKKIVKKRSKNLYTNQLIVLSGYFNSVGGNDPNYHFDYGMGQKTTIECTISEAIELKEYLYQTISSLVQKKYAIDDLSNVTYYHCSVLKNEQIAPFRKLINNLDVTTDIFERLDILYDFSDNSNSKVDDLLVLLKSYRYLFNDINEYKTLLILTKTFKDNPLIKNIRQHLLNDFETLMKTL